MTSVNFSPGKTLLNNQWLAFATVLILNAVIALLIAVLLSRRLATPGRNAMICMLIGLAVWAFCYAMITLSTSLEAKRFWLKLENIGILTVPVFWFFFTLQYTRLDKWLNKYTAAVFLIIPVVSWIILFSGSWFHFYYASVSQMSEGSGPLLIERGPWYLVALIHSYLLNLLGMGLLIWQVIEYRNIYREQMAILVSAILIPWLTNVFYQVASGFNSSSSTTLIDLTPISFTVTAFLISAGVFGLRLFDLMPIARHVVIEYIPEMVVVVDAHDRVLDANKTAQQWLGKTLDEIVGKDPMEVFSKWPELLNRFLASHETHEEIQIHGDPPLTLDLDVSALYNRFNVLEGRVIVAHDATEHKWLENDLKYANEALIRQLEEIQKLRDELEQQAIRDPLTNVYNRRYMVEFLENEIARAEREKLPVSIVMMDLDNFKQFNDNYGHKCGDMILKAFANFLLEHTRRADVVCRYGGEEFVILMPNTSHQIGYERAEMWRQDFSETPVEYEGIKFSITFSAGVATFPQHGHTGDLILQAADRVLYRSKDGGKNKVTAYLSRKEIKDAKDF
ncbi:MAG TPA: histidine kinase N-terminal 7TM domain-containing protein [Anaerolineales bacterium]|nr:histidine kinase N-terminal 7TM domain-containing protein [Anaerolineales bacterium]